MDLTRAQCVSLFGLAMNSPLDIQIELSKPDNRGNIAVRLTSESLGMQKTVKLLATGGAKTISDYSITPPVVIESEEVIESL